MDSKFRSSFIPKASFEKESDEGASFKIFSTLAILIFVVALVVTGGAFLYKVMLKGEIKNQKSQVSSALAAIDRTTINEIISFEKRLLSVQEILGNHVAISEYFAMLEKETVSQVQFTDVKYDALPGANVVVNMNGKAKSYAAVALQEDALLKNPNTLSVSFGDMKTDEKTGIVSFAFKGEFKSDLVDFSLPVEIMDNIEIQNE